MTTPVTPEEFKDFLDGQLQHYPMKTEKPPIYGTAVAIQMGLDGVPAMTVLTPNHTEAQDAATICLRKAPFHGINSVLFVDDSGGLHIWDVRWCGENGKVIETMFDAKREFAL